MELALGIAVLVIPAVLAVVSFAPWLERQAFVRTAAAEAARAAVLAEGDPAAAGSAVVADLAIGRGLSPSAVRVRLCDGPEWPAGTGGGSCVLVRDSFVTVVVTTEVSLMVTPWGSVGGLSVSAEHAEPVDAYRSLP